MITKHYKIFTIISGFIMLLLSAGLIVYAAVVKTLNMWPLLRIIIVISGLCLLYLDIDILNISLRKWKASGKKEEEQTTQALMDKLKVCIDKEVYIKFKHVPGVTDPNESRTLTGTLRYGKMYDNDVFDYYVEQKDGTKIEFNINFVISIEEVI